MEQQFKFLVEEYHRGEWNPLMVKNKIGEKVQKQVKITDDEAESMNKYSKEYGLRYVKQDVKEIEVKEPEIVDEKAQLIEEYQSKFRKKPFHGWSIEQLKEKLNS
jgi:hypothetical protein